MNTLCGTLRLSQERGSAQRPRTDVLCQSLPRPRSATKASETQLCKTSACPCCFPHISDRSAWDIAPIPAGISQTSDLPYFQSADWRQAGRTQLVWMFTLQHGDNHRALTGVTRDACLLFPLPNTRQRISNRPAALLCIRGKAKVKVCSAPGGGWWIITSVREWQVLPSTPGV